MDKNEKKIRSLVDWILQGDINTMWDYSEEDDEYKQAKAFLTLPIDELTEELYNEVLPDCQKEVRFLGTNRIKEIIKAKTLKVLAENKLQ